MYAEFCMRISDEDDERPKIIQDSIRAPILFNGAEFGS